MKKFIAALLGAVLLTGSTAGLVACGDDGGDDKKGGGAKYEYDITIWVGEYTKTITEGLINDFNRTNTSGLKFNAKVNEVTESVASGDVLQKFEQAPEMFCFAQDQLAELVKNEALSAPSAPIVQWMKSEHTETAMGAVTLGEDENAKVWAYPLTEDNGYFLYYDKSVISPDQAATIEGIIEQCKTSGRPFCFALETGWYAASFFYGAGAKSEWTVDSNGNFTAYDDTFNKAEGLLAAKGMQKVMKAGTKVYLNSADALNFNASTPAAAVVSGIWDYSVAENALKENLGIAPLPSFTVDGATKTLVSPLGCKMLGVTRQTDVNKATALSLLAQYLTKHESQMKRFTALGWGPSTKAALTNTDVQNSVALKALKQTGTLPQGQYPIKWWPKVQTLAGRIKSAETDSAIQTNLNTYYEELGSLLV